MDDGYTRYPPAKGFADLRQAIAEKLKSENGIVADPDTEIYVAVGAMQVAHETAGVGVTVQEIAAELYKAMINAGSEIPGLSWVILQTPLSLIQPY